MIDGWQWNSQRIHRPLSLWLLEAMAVASGRRGVAIRSFIAGNGTSCDNLTSDHSCISRSRIGRNRRLLCFLGLAAARQIASLARAWRRVALRVCLLTHSHRCGPCGPRLCRLWRRLHNVRPPVAMVGGRNEARPMGHCRRRNLSVWSGGHLVGA